VDINTALETIRLNIKISTKETIAYHELKKYKSWFDKGCSKSLDQRQLKLLQRPRKINGENLNNIRHEASRKFRNKKREYLKDKMQLLQ
jgi:hypothetical protein